jgi:hypothetical protein
MFRASGGSTFVLDEIFEAGAILVGRRMFDLASAWGSRSPIRDAPIFVVTHKPPTKHAFDGSPFTFVTDGIESEIQIHLDVLLGEGVRLFDDVPLRGTVRLEQTRLIEAPGITHPLPRARLTCSG